MNPRLKEWLKRYLPAEIVAAIVLLLTVWLTFSLTGTMVVAAYVGTICEALGYYCYIAVRDINKDIRHHKENNIKYGFFSFLKNFRNLILEFGLSEALDTFLVRPFFIFFLPLLLGNLALGVLLAKLVSDLIFYIPTVIFYELRKKHLKD